MAADPMWGDLERWGPAVLFLAGTMLNIWKSREGSQFQKELKSVKKRVAAIEKMDDDAER